MNIISLLRTLSPYVIGLVFVSAGLFKSFDPSAFSLFLESYGFIPSSFTPVISYSVITVELILGLSLILFLVPRIVISSLAGLTVLFIIVTFWGWIQGMEQGCGCFGLAVERTPLQVIIEDALILAGLALCWWKHKLSPLQTAQWKRYVFVTGCAASLIITVFGKDLPVESLATQLRIGSDLSSLEVLDISHNFSEGSFLVILLSTDCAKCPEYVTMLNTFSQIDQLPGVVGIFAGTKEESITFFWENLPDFPVGHAQYTMMRKYFRKLPKLFFLRNGTVQYIWDKDMPSINQITEIVSEIN